MKRVVNNITGAGGGDLGDPLPLLDCVADFQLLYGTDSNDDGVPEWSSDVSALSAEQLREQLVEVRVHILAQSGQRDDSYTYPTDNVYVGSEGQGRIASPGTGTTAGGSTPSS